METEPKSPISSQLSSIAPQPVKVLVVEDNLTNQKVLVRQLQSLGYAADVVTNGQAAVEAAAENAYQIIFMDCRLPGMDGYAATRLIRQREQLSGTYRAIIVALTANDDPQAQIEATAAEMDDFLTKPLRRETLLTTLKRWSQQLQLGLADRALEQTVESTASLLNQWAAQLDLARLHQLSDHNPEFEQELLQLYLDDTQERIQQLQQAVAQQNFLQVEQIAHHIKGASASIGAVQLEKIAGQLEQQAKEQQLENICIFCLQLERTLALLGTLFEHSIQVVFNN